MQRQYRLSAVRPDPQHGSPAIAAQRIGKLPPQLNLQTPIPEIAPALVGAGELAQNARHVMSVNLGFGGSNAALVFSHAA